MFLCGIIKITNDYEDRTIDIDILFYNNDIINEENLTIPHKYVHLRAFNLVPMLELNSDFVHNSLKENFINSNNERNIDIGE